MANLQRLETNDPRIGGILLSYEGNPTGVSAVWKVARPCADPRALAQDVASRLLDRLISARRVVDADNTNWVSVVAACEKLIRDWNFSLARALGEAPDFGDGVTPSRGAASAQPKFENLIFSADGIVDSGNSGVPRPENRVSAAKNVASQPEKPTEH